MCTRCVLDLVDIQDVDLVDILCTDLVDIQDVYWI